MDSMPDLLRRSVSPPVAEVVVSRAGLVGGEGEQGLAIHRVWSERVLRSNEYLSQVRSVRTDAIRMPVSWFEPCLRFTFGVRELLLRTHCGFVIFSKGVHACSALHAGSIPKVSR